jgi:hypothetical protein
VLLADHMVSYEGGLWLWRGPATRNAGVDDDFFLVVVESHMIDQNE